MTDEQIREQLEAIAAGLADYLEADRDDVMRWLVDALTGEHEPIREVHWL